MSICRSVRVGYDGVGLVHPLVAGCIIGLVKILQSFPLKMNTTDVSDLSSGFSATPTRIRCLLKRKEGINRRKERINE